ncbi:MAG: energy transducer TonB [Candidatus Acidiferrales bacterium]
MSEPKPTQKERETRLLFWRQEARGWTLDRQLRRSELFSALVHGVVVLALVSLPYLNGGANMKPKPKTVEFTSWGEIPYQPIYPRRARASKSGGGGGGGERNPLKASRGRLPRFSLEIQLAPPAAVNRNLNPRLAAEPTVVVSPEIKFLNPDTRAYGDPTSNATIPSGGQGHPAGIGDGTGLGVGPGDGEGVGPGRKFGAGGGEPYGVGGGVSPPVCIYCPQPEYSEEARKARYQAKVSLWAVVDTDGHVRDVRVVRAAGMGLDEQAIATVKSWRFKPAERNNRAVPVYMTIEIDFHLY